MKEFEAENFQHWSSIHPSRHGDKGSQLYCCESDVSCEVLRGDGRRHRHLVLPDTHRSDVREVSWL